MTVGSVRLTSFAIPYRRPLQLAGGTTLQHRGILIEVTDDQGTSGVGEVAPGPGTSSEDIEALAGEARQRAGRLRGAEVADVEQIEAAAADTPGPLRAGLETALLDLLGKRTSKSIAEILGRGRDDIPERAPVNAMLDRQPPADALARARQAHADGFRTIKLKVEPERFDELVATVGSIRDALGDVVRLRLDCNAAWPSDRAAAALHALERFAVEYVEQPVAGLDALAALRRQTTTPVAIDESVVGRDSVRRAIELGAADVVVLKPARIGLIEAARAARLARDAGLAVTITSNLETSVGILAALQLAAAIGEVPDRPDWAHGLATIDLLDGDLTETPARAERGHLRVPNQPGSGFELDRARLERWSL